MKLFLKKHVWAISIICLIGANFLLAGSMFGSKTSGPTLVLADQTALNKDLEDFNSKHLQNFKELSDYFTNLANRKGAEYAYQLLNIVPVPPGTDMHLLGHAVGDVLYKQEGVKGIYKCTQDFRNACSHTIVIGMLFDKGEAALKEIADVCRHAPGGSGAYTMCFHGLGHGVLAYNNYDLAATALMCQKTGTPEYGYRESSECVGGAIMEMIGGGFHDRVAWAAQRPKYLSDTLPLLPCSSDIISSKDKPMCYMYLTPHLFQAAGASLDSPSPDTFAKAFSFCDKVPSSDQASRQACYGGFGKEFIVLAKQRDIRNMSVFSDSELATVHKWCSLAGSAEGIEYCTGNALASLYWGGENDPKTSVRFCDTAGDLKDRCFSILTDIGFQYLKAPDALQSFCSTMSDPYKTQCLQRLK